MYTAVGAYSHSCTYIFRHHMLTHTYASHMHRHHSHMHTQTQTYLPGASLKFTHIHRHYTHTQSSLTGIHIEVSHTEIALFLNLTFYRTNSFADPNFA